MQGAILDIPVTALNAVRINVAAAVAGNVPVDWTYDGVTYHGFLDYVPVSSGGGGVAGKSLVLQEAIVARNESPSTLTLPTDYATYKKVAVSVYTFNARAVSFFELDIPALVAYPSTTLSTDAGSVLWRANTRILTLLNNNSRIIYAEIHD